MHYKLSRYLMGLCLMVCIVLPLHAQSTEPAIETEADVTEEKDDSLALDSLAADTLRADTLRLPGRSRCNTVWTGSWTTRCSRPRRWDSWYGISMQTPVSTATANAS